MSLQLHRCRTIPFGDLQVAMGSNFWRCHRKNSNGKSSCSFRLYAGASFCKDASLELDDIYMGKFLMPFSTSQNVTTLIWYFDDTILDSPTAPDIIAMQYNQGIYLASGTHLTNDGIYTCPSPCFFSWSWPKLCLLTYNHCLSPPGVDALVPTYPPSPSFYAIPLPDCKHLGSRRQKYPN